MSARARSPRRLVLAALLVAVPILVATLGPWLAPHQIGVPIGPPLTGPHAGAPLGTDQLGRDVLSRVLDGGRDGIALAAAAAAVAETIGVTVGAIAALAPNAVGALTSYLNRVVLAVPSILLLAVLVAGFGHSTVVLFAGATLVLVPTLVPVIVTKTRQLVDQPFIDAARLDAVGTPVIITRELLPNLVPIIAADLATRFIMAVFLITTAGFLGFGPQAPAADWGLMISDAQPTLAQQPWPVVVPAALLACLATGVMLVSHHVIAYATSREATGTLDPAELSIRPTGSGR